MSNPVIVPSPMPQPPRECVVVDGHRYCRDEEITPKMLGAGLLFVVLIVVWMIFVAWLYIDRFNSSAAAVAFFGPLILAGLIMLFW